MRTDLPRCFMLLLGAFLVSCGGAAEDDARAEQSLEAVGPRSLSMSIVGGGDTTPAGATTFFTVSTTSFGGGPSETVNLSLGGLPAGIRADLSPSFLFAGSSARLAIRVAEDVPAGRFQFTVFANGAAGFASASAVGDVVRVDGAPGPDEPVALGASVAGLSGERSTGRFFRFEVPEGHARLTVGLAGGSSGDADLYVRRGQRPTLAEYSCRSLREGSEERCKLSSPAAGTYFALVHGYAAYADVTLSVSVE